MVRGATVRSKPLHWRRFLSSQRATVALESVLASIPLLFALAGVFEIVRPLFIGDLLKRAAYAVARTNALYDTAASNAADLESRIRQAIDAEIGDLLDFDLTMGGTCGEPGEGESPADFCLSVQVEVYDNPCDMRCALKGEGPGKSQKDNAELGGDAGDMVVVRLRLQPRSVLSRTQQLLFGDDGLRAAAVMRNERIQETG